MGRYYNGDIEGKFWFALQSSDDADFFGVEGYQPEMLEYQFEEGDKDKVVAGIKKCEDKLGEFEKQIDAYFDKQSGWTDELIGKHLKLPEKQAHTLMEYYARVRLGRKILKSIEECGQCYFDAEL